MINKRKYIIPKFLNRDKIHEDEIHKKKTLVESVKNVKESELVLIERHNGHPLVGWHIGNGIRVVHQFNPETKHFESLTTTIPNKSYSIDSSPDIQMKKGITMELKKNGDWKYSGVVKKIWKVKE